MRRFGPSHRDLPLVVRRRVDRVAGEINTFLVIVAIGLAMLDFLYAAQYLVDALPPSVPSHSPDTNLRTSPVTPAR